MRLDQFGRKCGDCASHSGQAGKTCPRYRQDWTKLTSQQKLTYIDAVKTVSMDPAFKPLYDSLIARHRESFRAADVQNIDDPVNSQFFAWNRYFLLEYEDLLRTVNSTVTVPYWDWTEDPSAPFSSPVFDPETGFGNSSSPENGSNLTCLSSGPFQRGLFEIKSLDNSTSTTCLSRQYNSGIFPSKMMVDRITALPATEFKEVHEFLHLLAHFNVCRFVGGHMATVAAASDPLYPLHLAQLDSLLARWQAVDSDHAQERYFVDRRPLAPELTLPFQRGLLMSDFYSNKHLPHSTAVEYV